MTKVPKGKLLLQLSNDPELLSVRRLMQRAYNRKMGLSVSFAKFVEGILANYMTSTQGKSLLMEAHRESQKQD